MKTQSVYTHNFIPALGLVGALIGSVILEACTVAEGKKNEVPAAAVVAGIPIDALIVRPGVLTESLEVTGTLIANQEVDIVSELTRKIVRVNVKEGSFVSRGSVSEHPSVHP